jgi:hypothetical protein
MRGHWQGVRYLKSAAKSEKGGEAKEKLQQTCWLTV